ncbi:MAG: pilin [bacterium]|nr:pilin [bacterium]
MVIFVFSGILFVGSLPAIAQQVPITANLEVASQATGMNQGSDLMTIIGRIIYVILGTLGIVLLGYLMYAGFLWTTAGGDQKNVDKAKAIIKNAIIGMVIVASAFAITAWIFKLLQQVDDGSIVGNGITKGGFPSASGALGGGIIEFHAPPRDAKDIPRNTAIVITFKEPIKISSFVQDYNDNGTPANLSDDATSSTTIGLNAAAVRIYPTGQPDKALQTADARARFTKDRKTFVMKPLKYLGSATQKMMYTVELMPGRSGIQREDGSAAFSGTFSSGYKWQFEVSTVIDTTPPQITSVIPFEGGRYAPNIVVQVNFSEMIDPTTAVGTVENGEGFLNLQVLANALDKPTEKQHLVNGTFKVSNQYRTTEFVTDLPCGENSCGRKIYCLPFDASITSLVHAATLSSQPPEAELTLSGYDGVTDLAGNSMDGNANGKAEGYGKDDYQWQFATTNKPNLEAPKIVRTRPTAGDSNASSNIPVDQPPQADFDSILQSSTLTTDSAFIKPSEGEGGEDTFWWTVQQMLINGEGVVASGSKDIVGGRASVDHRLYAPAIPKKFVPDYYPYLLSDLQNVYQNCFNPAASASCKGPNCCDEKETMTACPFPVQP